MTVGNLLAKVAKRSPSLLCYGRKLIAPERGDEFLDVHSAIFAQRKDIVKANLCTPFIPVCRRRGLNDSMMDKQEYRKRWVRALVEQEQSIQAFASKIDTDPNYISSILSDKGKRNVGDELARRIEQEYNLPTGAIDYPSIAVQNITKLLSGMPSDDLESILEFVKFKKATKN